MSKDRSKVLRLPPTFALVLPVLRQIGVSRIVEQQCPIRRDALMTHGEVVEAMLMHILQDSQRLPLYKMHKWAGKHNLNLLYGIAAKSFSDDRLGDTLDALWPHTEDLYAKIITALLMRYGLQVKILLWDLTHITFEGEHKLCDMIQPGFGHGVVHEKQMKLSAHVDAQTGLPIMYEPLAGATNQTPLAADYLEELQALLEREDLLVISDKAGICWDNIAAYYRANAFFVSTMQTTPDELAVVHQPDLADFAPLAYRSANRPDDYYLYWSTKLSLKRQKRRQPLQANGLVIFSSQLQRTESERRDQDIRRALAELKKVQQEYLNKTCYARREAALKHIENKIKGQAKGIVLFELSGDDKQMSLRYRLDRRALREARKYDGRYLLVHNLEASPDAVFALYKRLYLVEHTFRNLNGLRVHPLWLHNPERIEALIFLWMLALAIFTLLGILAQRAELDNQPHYHKLTPREMLQRFDLVLIEVARRQGPRPRYQLIFDDEQLAILAALGLDQPHRMLNAGS